jgi:glycosyltransferase involved in cell wall biosynthesis
MSALVSIITPHYERPELLRQTVESVQRQSFRDWELIIIDDGSCSETWNTIQALAEPRVIVIQREEGPKGPSHCRNLGVAASSGQYLLFLDSDDLLHSQCLLRRVEVARDQPDYDLWVFPVELFRLIPGDLKLPWNQMSDDSETLERFLRSDGPWCVSSPLWRRTAFQRIDGFNPRVLYGDDADLHIRALLAGTRFLQCPEALKDVFVRRSDAARITNSCSEALLESRRVRLTEGQRALRTMDAPSPHHKVWEGQYFVEGEFLLFTQKNSKQELLKLREMWDKDYPGFSWQRTLGWSYLWLAVSLKCRFYFLLRLLRRLMMIMLPQSWFPGQAIQKRRLAEFWIRK